MQDQEPTGPTGTDGQLVTQDKTAAVRRTLDEIAEDVRRETQAAERDFQSSVEHAIRAGQALREAKTQLAHGQWLPWLRENFALSERTARNYMRLADKSATVADLPTVRGALAVLTEPRQSEDKPEDTPQDRPEAEPDIGLAYDIAKAALTFRCTRDEFNRALESVGLSRASLDRDIELAKWAILAEIKYRAPLGPEDARALTEDAREADRRVFHEAARAYEKGAHVALGMSWAGYVEEILSEVPAKPPVLRMALRDDLLALPDSFKMADASEEAFEQAIKHARADGDLSAAGLVRVMETAAAAGERG